MTLAVCHELLTQFVVPYMTVREVHTLTCIYNGNEPETEKTSSRSKTTVPTWLREGYDKSVCDLYLACRTGDAQFVTDFAATDGIPVEVHGRLFNIACYKGHLEVVKALDKKLQTGAYFANVIMNRKNSFSHACIGGHLHVAQWLCSRFGKDLTTAGLLIVAAPSDVRRALANIALEALKRGHEHVAKWLLRSFPFNRNERQIHFITACKYGNVHFATWLRETFPVIVSLDYYLFLRDLLTHVCAEGHLIVLVRLDEWGLLPHTVDSNNGVVVRAFSFACGENRLHVASWLMAKYNISARDFDREYAVYDMYVDLKQSGFDTMASWLVSTFPGEINTTTIS